MLRLKLDLSGSDRLQAQISEQIQGWITSGKLRPGACLPATRELSMQLGVSRNTAALAYERLASEGFIVSKRSVGTFVASCVPEGSSISRSTGRPNASPANANSQSVVRFVPPVGDPVSNVSSDQVTDCFPYSAWKKLLSNRLKSLQAATSGMPSPCGIPELRAAIAEHLLLSRGIRVHSDQIVVVEGRQDALFLASQMNVLAQAPAIVEMPCLRKVVTVLDRSGRQILPAAVDSEGLIVDELPKLESAILYTTPSYHHATGSILSLIRRQSLLKLAEANDLMIIEDDCDSDFRYDGSMLPPLYSLDDNERTIYINSFSKLMGAAFCLGYMVVPRHLAKEAQRQRLSLSDGVSWLEQAAMADFLESGGYRRHIRRVRRCYLARRNALLSSLMKYFGHIGISSAQTGTHVVWQLPSHLPNAGIVQKLAASAGMSANTLESADIATYGALPNADRYLLLGYGSITEKCIESGIARLSALLNSARCVEGFAGAAGA